jgi:hypothetical protein
MKAPAPEDAGGFHSDFHRGDNVSRPLFEVESISVDSI